MSLRIRTGPNTQPANQAAASRLYAVLKVGAKYVDEDGKKVKYVEFEPDDPKSSSIQRNCIPVPWIHYANANRIPLDRLVRIGEYCRDVSSDPRLKNLGLGALFDNSVSPTQDAYVQEYATVTYRSRVTSAFANSEGGLWVMDFNADNDDFARYCLVPVDVRTIEERLRRALDHIKTYLSEEALARYDPSQPDMTDYRDFYVHHWTRALQKLEDL